MNARNRTGCARAASTDARLRRSTDTPLGWRRDRSDSRMREIGACSCRRTGVHHSASIRAFDARLRRAKDARERADRRNMRSVARLKASAGGAAMTAATSAEAPNASQRWRAVIAASIGNALEWFDFVVYGFLAVTMAKLFFPTGIEPSPLLLRSD